MIINQFSLKPFLIDSQIPRKGILLYLRGNNQRKTTVEISPLPGYSKETFEDAQEQLSQIRQPIMATLWSKPALNTLSRMNLYPSVYFALETGILDLLDPIEKREGVKTYSLLFGTPDSILSYAKELKEKGQREIKVKLGHLNISTAHELIDQLKGDFNIRLDFNRKWDIEDTLSFCKCYPADEFHYMEEPCQHPQNLLDFPYPFALDETLRAALPFTPKLLSAPKLKALILKPTLHYPLIPFLKSRIPCIVTSSFESAIGIGQIRRLIKRHGLDITHHGLDTLHYFDKHDEMPYSPTAPAAR